MLRTDTENGANFISAKVPVARVLLRGAGGVGHAPNGH